MTTYREAIGTRISARSQCSIRLLGCLLLCLFGLPVTGHTQVTTTIGKGIVTTFAGLQGVTGDDAADAPAQATGISVGSPLYTTTDSTGNVYFTDNASSAVWVVYAGTAPPNLLTKLYPNLTYTRNDAYVIVNSLIQQCFGGACGDGDLATNGQLNAPAGLTFDSSGNLYIADSGNNAIRRVDANSGRISTIAGDPMHTAFGYSGENIQASSSLLYGPYSVAFDGAGNLYVADANNAIIRKIDTNGMITTVAGTVPTGMVPNQTINGCTAAPCGDRDLATNATLGYAENIVVDSAGDIYVTDSGAAAIRRIDAQTKKIQTVAGTLSASAPSYPDTCVPGAPPACGDESAATIALLNFPVASYLDAQGNLYIADYGDNGVRVVDTSGIIHTVVGELSSTGGFTPDGSAADLTTLFGPSGLAFDSGGNLYIADNGNNIVRKVTPHASLPAQTITFTPPLAATYGAQPIDLASYTTVSSGLLATFSVTSGPGTISGNTLSITGAGTIAVRATQAGSINYASATPVSVNIVVAQAMLTVAAPPDAGLKEGSPIPATYPYTITGFVNADTQQSVVTGAPSLVVETSPGGTVLPPGTIPPTGSYTIVISQQTLTAGANYQLSFANGTLLVTAGQTQTISFGAYTPPAVYGGASSTFTFSVSTSAVPMPPITLNPSGPVKLQQVGSTTTWSATVDGAGLVTITATQAGNYNYAPATATTQFVVSPAVLTVPVNNATRPFGAINPMFTIGTPTGFVGADTSAVLNGGQPSYTTTATATSNPGLYPLTATAGTLFAQNYTFQFVPATLTITPAAQQITNFAAPVNLVSQQDYPLQAVATSGLPLVYSATGAVQIDSSGAGFVVTGGGPATITATQAGNIDYAAVSATISFNVATLTQYVTAVPASVVFGAVLPQLNWCFATLDPVSGLAVCSSTSLPANSYSGAPALTTTAASGSPTGSYPINVAAGTLTSSAYSFVFEPGTLTITPTSTYTLTANPSSVTLARGQSATVTITMTPVNNYLGTVAIACSGLPVGVTCMTNPASLTTTLDGQGKADPVSSTLTISVAKTVAQNAIGSQGNMYVAGVFGLPGLFAGILIFYRRQQFKRHSIFTGILLLVALAASMSCVSACGGGGSHSGGAEPGTTQIMITGTSAASAGTVAQSVGLTVIIQ